MKIYNFVISAALLAALTACSPVTSKEESAKTESKTTVAKPVVKAPVAKDGKVINLEDASAIAPGVKVDQLTVIDFNAIWCGPCRQLTPVVDELAEKYKGRVTFISVDVDRFSDLFRSYNLGSSIPAVVFLLPDGTQRRYIGTSELLPASAFEALIEQNLQ
ncbi:MAG: hypothetical protein K2J38_02550 [Muribaculaceae bacterium]|nr:hypothetical protein [Muribaculaceae bacterium]